MRTYVIRQREVSLATYTVDAETYEDAIDKFEQEGGFDPVSDEWIECEILECYQQ